MNTSVAFNGETLIPELIRANPASRAVLDKYGLKGCGGPEGPYETLRIFARAHEVDLGLLLAELSDCSSSSTGSESGANTSFGASASVIASEDKAQPAAQLSSRADLADVIYRRFFLAAVIFLLTVGATWGAHILFAIGTAGSFTAASVFDIQAHAQAQVYGWMTLAIMGFAYQAFPRFWHTSLANPGRANSSFWLMIAGILLSVAGIYAAPAALFSAPLAVVGGALELCAVSLFVLELVHTFRAANKATEPYIWYLAVSALWLVLSTFINLIHTWALVWSARAPELSSLVVQFQAPLRDMQFYGLGMTIIFGVSLRTLPHIFGARSPSGQVAWQLLPVLTLAVFAQCALGLIWQTDSFVPAAIMLLVALIMGWQFRLWEPFPEGDRSEKFIKAAWVWLLISLGMAASAPLAQIASGVPNSHAYAGAVRHAITVGFISLMIMGYSAKVVATLNGLDARLLSRLYWPFILVNIGCAVRVVGQSLTDVLPAAFPVTGVSGCLEAIGMTLWGVHIARIIVRGRRPAPLLSPAASAPSRIEGDHIVADVLDWFPQTEAVFVDFGFTAVTNPVMRRTVARQVTIARACRIHGFDAEAFLLLLNQSLEPSRCAGCTGGGCGGEDKDEKDRCH